MCHLLFSYSNISNDCNRTNKHMGVECGGGGGGGGAEGLRPGALREKLVRPVEERGARFARTNFLAAHLATHLHLSIYQSVFIPGYCNHQ